MPRAKSTKEKAATQAAPVNLPQAVNMPPANQMQVPGMPPMAQVPQAMPGMPQMAPIPEPSAVTQQTLGQALSTPQGIPQQMPPSAPAFNPMQVPQAPPVMQAPPAPSEDLTEVFKRLSAIEDAISNNTKMLIDLRDSVNEMTAQKAQQPVSNVRQVPKQVEDMIVQALQVQTQVIPFDSLAPVWVPHLNANFPGLNITREDLHGIICKYNCMTPDNMVIKLV